MVNDAINNFRTAIMNQSVSPKLNLRSQHIYSLTLLHLGKVHTCRMVPVAQCFRWLNFKVHRYFSLQFCSWMSGILGHYRFMLCLNYLRDQEMPSKRLQTAIQIKIIVYLWIAINGMLNETKHPQDCQESSCKLEMNNCCSSRYTTPRVLWSLNRLWLERIWTELFEIEEPPNSPKISFVVRA